MKNVRPQYADDKFRPQYHYSNIKNWANDPNGPIFFNGRWHLYYQHNPAAITHGNIHWAHAVSDDLIHWEEKPIALYPDALGACWSGSIVFDEMNTSGLFTGYVNDAGVAQENGLVAVFTSFSEEVTQSIAYSYDGEIWHKYHNNPVIDQSNNPSGYEMFRDPKVFWHEETAQWLMVIAGGPLMIYSSPNLIDWTFNSIDNAIQTELPDLFEIKINGTDETKWILMFSGEYYMVGELVRLKDGTIRYMPQTEKIDMNFGPDCYSGLSWSDVPDGRVLTINWMISPLYITALSGFMDKFTGIFTMVYELRLRDEGGIYRIYQAPAKEYERLRKMDDAVSYPNLILNDTSENPLAGVSMAYGEIGMTIQSNGARVFFAEVFAGENEKTVISYDFTTQILTVDRTRSGAAIADAFLSAYQIQLPADKAGKLTLRLYLDRCSLEVFANDGNAVGTFLVFPSEDSKGMRLGAEGGPCLISCEVYHLKDRWV